VWQKQGSQSHKGPLRSNFPALISKKGAQEFGAAYGAGGVLDRGLWVHDSSLLLHCKACALVILDQFSLLHCTFHVEVVLSL